jgi:hypothetical protein
MPVIVKYHFSQRLPLPAKEAFDWCTDFDPSDHALMGDENAERQITQLARGLVILKDTFQTPQRTIEKQKLVHLYPDQLTWVSTHLTGPNKHSQFLYVITPQGKDACILNFTALHVEYDEKVDAELLAAKLCKEDADAWKLLAKAMHAQS